MLSQKELDLVEKLKAFAREIGRKPSRNEFKEHLGQNNNRFGSLTFNKLLELAGLPLHPNQKLAKIDQFKPKILILDIETCVLEAYVFGIRDQYIGTNQIKEDNSVLSWAAKWLDDEEIFYEEVDHSSPRNDERIINSIFLLLNKADAVICHNVAFDIKVLQGRFLKYGLKVVRPFVKICTLQIARKNFKLTSNKLEYLARFLGVIEKLDHGKYPGMELFKQCSIGNPDAFKELRDYNIRDIVTLEAIYLKLRRYDNSIRYSVFEQENICSCGSTDMRKIDPVATKTNVFETYQCVDCGRCFRGDGLLSGVLRKHLLK
jgi:DNA polymerase elongation subunit (family B)